MSNFFFGNFIGLFRVFSSAIITYAVVVIMVRLAGKRATSQMNNFDWIVTVGIGSLVGSTIILEDLPLFEGLIGIATLLAAQYLATKLSVYWPQFSKLIHSEPTIVFYKGEFIQSAMKKERITKQEILAAMRENGLHAVSEVEAVILETDAKFSVLTKSEDSHREHTTISELPNYPE